MSGIATKYGLSVYPRFNPPTSLYDVYLGEDKCVWTGVGTLDYPAFLDVGIDIPNQLIPIPFREGSDHNNTPDGDIMLMISNGVTETVPVSIVAHGGRTLTNPSILVLSTGRWLLTYGYHPPAGGRDILIGFSDDQGQNWTVDIRMTDDYIGADNQITGPTSPIEVDGYVYKVCYARLGAAGGRHGIIYRKAITADFTIADDWEQMPKIYASENFNGEEPGAVQLADGSFLFALRSDPDDQSYYIYSPNKGTNNSRIAFMNLSVGKNPIWKTPNETIISIGRLFNTGGRTSFSYSKNIPEEGFVTDFIDERTGIYVYGGGHYIPWLNKSLAFWAVEMLGAVTPGASGPCLIIKRELIESLTPLPAPTVYDINLQSLYDYTQGQRFNMPSTSVKDLNDLLVLALKAATIWDILDYLTISDLNGTNLIEFSKHNWKQPNNNIGVISATPPTIAVDGWEFSNPNTAQWIDSNFLPSVGVNYQQDDACAGVWVDDNIASAGSVIGSSQSNISTTSRGPRINPRSATDTISYYINDGTATSITGITDSRGLNMAQRRSSTDKRFWKNGVQIDSVSVASGTRSITTVGIGATKFLNGPGTFGPWGCSIVFFGASLTGLELDMYNILNAYKIARAAL